MSRRLRPPATDLIRLGSPLPPAVDAEGHLLTRCARAGVRLPVGAVLLDGGRSLGPLRRSEHVLLRPLGTSQAVRVSSDDVAGLGAALSAAKQAASPAGRCDLLVLRSVRSVHAGRATVRASQPYDVVDVVEGEPYDLAGAEVRTLHVPRLERRWHRAHRGADQWRTPLPPYGMRLSRLLRDVRRALGPGDRVVAWADDGHTCWLVGVAAIDR
ncbi:MAG: hypothetical protein KY451_00555 [Actinobacteria bacterium]|nr:hypothetical protein [Actinomycetota bacterium]